MDYHRGVSELRIKQKLIIIKADNESRGSLVEVIERNRFRSYSLKIDLGGVFWALQGLRQVWRRRKDQSFFNKYRSSSAVFCLQKYSNKRGVFVELSKWAAGVRRSNIVIPAGVDGQGWLAVAKMFESIIRGSSRVLEEGERQHRSDHDLVRTHRGPTSVDMSVQQKTGAN